MSVQVYTQAEVDALVGDLQQQIRDLAQQVSDMDLQAIRNELNRLDARLDAISSAAADA